MQNPLKGKSKREIMIYIGQSPWGDFDGTFDNLILFKS